jgi:hypothetical protein
MKTNFFSLLFLLVLLNSCGYDRDDRIPRVNDNTQFVSEDGTVYYTGLTCTGTGEYITNPDNTIDDLVIPTTLPEQFDLSEFLPPIGNQGSQSSCVSWAVTYYMKSLQERVASPLPYDENTILSPAYTYNQVTMGNCTGTDISQTLEILKGKGACSLLDFPYDFTSCALQPTAAIDQLALPNRISGYKYLSGNNMVAEMKTLLTEQKPILIAAFLTPKFGKVDGLGIHAYRPHVVNYDRGGCHAMLVVGFSDEYNAFKVVNSWGESWGDDGFVWIDYAAFENVNQSNAPFRVINQAIVAYDL